MQHKRLRTDLNAFSGLNMVAIIKPNSSMYFKNNAFQICCNMFHFFILDSFPGKKFFTHASMCLGHLELTEMLQFSSIYRTFEIILFQPNALIIMNSLKALLLVQSYMTQFILTCKS